MDDRSQLSPPEALWDRSRVDLDGLAEWADRSWRRTIEDFRWVPLGLAHAESIDVVRSNPQGFQPLSPSSAWSASGRSLAVRVEEASDGLRALAGYARWARWIRGRSPPVGVASGRVEPAVLLELAGRWELGHDQLEQLERSGVLNELLLLASSRWSPRVCVQRDSRPGVQRELGARAGQAWARRTSGRPGPTLVAATAESRLVAELLSPYPSDLGLALRSWARQERAQLPPDLSFALDEDDRGRDLSALLADELGRQVSDPALLEERRVAERSQGLELEDIGGAAFGVAELERLEAPDRRMWADLEPTGSLRLLVGGTATMVGAAFEAWLEEAGPSPGHGLGLLGSAQGLAYGPSIPEAVWTREDGYALPAAGALAGAAEALEVPAARMRETQLPADHWIAQALGRVRRDMVRGRLDARCPVAVALHPPLHDAVNHDARIAILDSGRTVLRALVAMDGMEGGSPGAGDARNRVSTEKNRPFVRRYRV